MLEAVRSAKGPVVRSDYSCFKNDGGQLFLAGEGSGTVELSTLTAPKSPTILAGRAPSRHDHCHHPRSRLPVCASPQSGDGAIMNIANHKVIAVMAVGKNPGFLNADSGQRICACAESGFRRHGRHSRKVHQQKQSQTGPAIQPDSSRVKAIGGRDEPGVGLAH